MGIFFQFDKRLSQKIDFLSKNFGRNLTLRETAQLPFYFKGLQMKINGTTNVYKSLSLETRHTDEITNASPTTKFSLHSIEREVALILV